MNAVVDMEIATEMVERDNKMWDVACHRVWLSDSATVIVTVTSLWDCM